MNWTQRYDRVILGHSKLVLLLLTCVLIGFGYRIKDFRVDASADTLILEHDKDLERYRNITARYGSSEYLFLAYTPHGDLLADATLKNLRALCDQLAALDRVSSVVTILDAPLLKNPKVPLNELRENIKILESPDVDMDMARREIRDSPLLMELLVSPDLLSTAIQINLSDDPQLADLFHQRANLRAHEQDGTITAGQAAELKRVKEAYNRAKDRASAARHDLIDAVRAIIETHRTHADLHLGGVPMIADDMITFVRRDLRVFGAGMLVFLVLTLVVIFRRIRWVVLPIICCITSAVIMMGGLGIFDWPVTVVSANFISLQLIISMALSIHIIVRYREIHAAGVITDHHALITETVRTIFRPCLYTALTTIAGFCSLMICDILPVVNFGWMMTLGIIVSLCTAFLLLPTSLMLMPIAPPAHESRLNFSVTSILANFTSRFPLVIFTMALCVVAVTIVGIAKLDVENSFINYFRRTTEIFRGMEFIDRNLGGTTPLDVIVDFKSLDDEDPVDAAPHPVDDFGDFEEFEEFEEEEEDAATYWYTPDKIEVVRRVHHYLDSLPAIGKVLSLNTVLAIAEDLTGNEEWDSFELALLFKEFPDDFRNLIINPYVSVENNQARFSVRIKDSLQWLRRDALLEEMQSHLDTQVGLEPGQASLTGVMILYNNMLQSLFKSQVQTIGVTVLAILVMFMILFRSIRIALIAIFPNLMASLVVLGAMGLLGISLDMMTITIVAISIGIAVDNTIHYIHRFRHEFATDRNYMQTMFRCHASIGKAMYYTSLTIIVGFSILSLSEFIPSVLFGLLTSLAMAIALAAALTLLPRMLMLFKAFGPEGVDAATPDT